MTDTNRDGNGGAKKRPNVISWEDYFMGTAILASKRSKDPKRQVGACIVAEDKRIVGLGYNGFPDRCHDKELPWGKGDGLENKHYYVCHAELNAIANKFSANLKGSTMYVGLFPCCHCAKLIIQSGIREIIYYSDDKAHKDEFKAAKRMFHAAGVGYRYQNTGMGETPRFKKFWCLHIWADCPDVETSEMKEQKVRTRLL